jgi:predicted SprT family Zn-dependent metalloprotease
MKTQKATRQVNLTYCTFNKVAFHGLLPSNSIDIHVRKTRKSTFFKRMWRSRKSKVLAYYSLKRRRIIVFEDSVRRKDLPEILLHEMVHMSMHLKKKGTGHTFSFWRILRNKLEKLGITPSKRLWWHARARKTLSA